jgi:hypothetical protein
MPVAATAEEILIAKTDAGDGAYLWVHTSGDVILWHTEPGPGNDGADAAARWHVGPAVVDELIASGDVDDVA